MDNILLISHFLEFGSLKKVTLWSKFWKSAKNSQVQFSQLQNFCCQKKRSHEISYKSFCNNSVVNSHLDLTIHWMISVSWQWHSWTGIQPYPAMSLKPDWKLLEKFLGPLLFGQRGLGEKTHLNKVGTIFLALSTKPLLKNHFSGNNCAPQVAVVLCEAFKSLSSSWPIGSYPKSLTKK